MVSPFYPVYRSSRFRIRPVQAVVTLLVSLLLASASTSLRAQTKAVTITTLTATANGTAATSIDSGTVVTLTAAVTAGPTAITRGQVDFCDASATYCTDIHLLGMAQLTGAGIATLKLRPSVGKHSYKAVFLGTNAYAGSMSGSSQLTATGKYPTTATIAQGENTGSYTLTATVSSSGNGAPGPTGQISLIDATSGNALLATGTLGSATVGPTLVNASNPQTVPGSLGIVAGDFNEDGNLDLAVGPSSATQPLSILLGNGTGNFTAAPASSITVTGNPVLVQDFNADGIPDILLADAFGHSITVLLGNGDGTFRVANGSPMELNENSLPVTADFNGDGIPDLIFSGGYYMVVLLGNGDGTFTQVPTSSSSFSEAFFSSMVVGDFNGDGIPDLAALGDNASAENTLFIFFGNGDGTFRQEASTTTSNVSSLRILATGDFNGDGNLDLASSDLDDPGVVTVLLGNGGGMFEEAAGSPIPVEPSSDQIAVGDFNGDGIADLFVGGQSSGPTLNVLLGNGNGTFRQMPTGSAGLPCCSNTVLGDFNNDGLTDIASSSFYYAIAQLLVPQLIQAATTVSGINPPGPGMQQVEVSYPGDSNFAGSVSDTTALMPFVAPPQIGPASGTYGKGLTIQLTDSTPGATIYYDEDGNTFVLYTAPITLSTLGTKQINYYAIENGYFDSPTATATYTISAATAVATVSVTPNATNVTNAEAVTVTVAVNGASGQPMPTGSVTLSAGAWSDQQTLSTGNATFTVLAGTLSSGSNTLTARYSGDATYAVASGTATVNVSPVVSTGQTPAAISPGSSASSTISFSAGSTYAGTMSLSCALTSSPSGAQSLPTCSMKPASITLAAGANISSTLTVVTTAAGATARLHPFGGSTRWFGGGGATLAMVLLFGIPARRRRWTSMLVLLAAIFAFGIIGCGGGNSTGSAGSAGGGGGGGGGQTTPATTAGNYVFTVTGTDSLNPQITTSTTVAVTVK